MCNEITVQTMTNIEIYMHKNIFLGNKWNTIQVFSISPQSYQQCTTAI